MPRKYTEARKAGNRKWDVQNLDRISIAVPKGRRDEIKAHADRRGESMNGFIGRAIDETMQRDDATSEQTVGKSAFAGTVYGKALEEKKDGRAITVKVLQPEPDGTDAGE